LGKQPWIYGKKRASNRFFKSLPQNQPGFRKGSLLFSIVESTEQYNETEGNTPNLGEDRIKSPRFSGKNHFSRPKNPVTGEPERGPEKGGPDNRDFCVTGGAKIHKRNKLLVFCNPLRYSREDEAAA
jgi:hypothetical protein